MRSISLVAALLLSCGRYPPPAPFGAPLPAFRVGDRLVVVGDLQRTSLLEFWREQNDRERERVVAAIVAEKPALLAITGDLVFDGSSARHWAAFDRLAAPLRAAAIPVVAALGNHEYWAGGDGARFFARLPRVEGRHFYTVDLGALRVIVLDSNKDDLARGAWAEQLGFYAAALAAADRDPAVRGVIVLLHHPPYTNSTVTGDEAHVQHDILPPFLAARKTLVLQAGHVHSYERFERGGKMLVVSGGGGGPRAALDVGPRRRHPDDLFHGPVVRDFNFVVYTLEESGLSAETRGLPKGGDAFATVDRFALPFPR